MSAVLSIRDLAVRFATPDGVVPAVNEFSFELAPGECVGIVGESGAGKSQSFLAVMGLLAANASVSGSARLDDTELLGNDRQALNAVRGSKLAMIFQDPLSALNPYYTVGKQIAEAYLVHHPESSKTEARSITLEMLKKVGIPNPEKRIDEYPHQFSGGMRQRIVIAIALINNPKVLIADEPTTALDVTVQAQILDLMKELQKEFNMAIILITHDLGVIAEAAQEVLVMYGGRIVEQSTVDALFSEPTHPYAWGLLGAVNSLELSGRGSLATIPGSPPSLISLPAGCSFNPRCAHSSEICTTDVPALRVVGSQGSVTACHLPNDEIISLGRKAAAR